MSSRTPFSIGRLEELLRRQMPPKWLAQYEPSIRATREEAPARSRPAQVWSPRLGRICHVLSLVELAVLLILLYHPHMFELQEQRMLAMEPMPHPLHGHPMAAGLMLLPLAGTIAVAERLGCQCVTKPSPTTEETQR